MYNLRAEYVTRKGRQSYESLGWINGHAVYYILPKEITLINATYRETSYNTSFAGSFSCNDDFYNRLWTKAQRTLLVTMRDTYMDCPDRERAQWWGDEVIESGESFYALCPQSHLLMKKGMYELMQWQKEDGTIFSPIPSSNYQTELPGQMLASVGLYGFWNYYLNTGDTATIADLYDSVKRYLAVWEYNEDGTLKSFTPNNEYAPAVVKKQIVMDVTDAPYPMKPVVPFIKVTQDRVVLEIQRGCIRGCRFCQAGMLYRPVRERNVERLKQYAHDMLQNTGHEEISLSSLSSSDYSELKELVTYLIDEFKNKGINISLPSLRIDAFSLDVMSKVQDIRKSSLTFAPEAGSQRMRDVINKGLTEEVILNGAGEAFEGGWTKVKLYFMLGLPTETEEDMKEIAHLAEKVARRYYEIPKDQRHGKCQITASSSFFVPKPFTPFQWAPMCKAEEYMRRAHLVNDEFKEQLNRKSLKYNWHDAEVTVLEGIMARGDRKISKAIEEAYRLGCLFDSWTESFHNELWMQAFENTGVDIDFYNLRERGEDELFPWDFIDIGVTRKFLRREWDRAMEEKVTPNCRMQCSGCGAAKFGGGVCYEGKN